MHGLLLYLFLGLAQTLAHNHPETDHELEVQRALQAAAFHVSFYQNLPFTILMSSYQCAPAIESFTASRKQAWAQRVLAGSPTLPSHQHLFSVEAFQDLSGSSDSKPHDGDDDETYMKCTPISDTHIQNNTCVLTPEVTEGPYYHNQDHPIRQNIAGLQDGLLLVCC